jgi:competence protein ComQ
VIVIEVVEMQSMKSYMIQAITLQIKNSELQKLVLSFVNEKPKLNFGQLTIAHHKAFGGKDLEIFQLAAAIELLILSFDIFDDLEDLDNMQEPWMQIDSSIALNAATTIYTLSQQTVLALSSPFKHQIQTAFLQYSIQAMEGQHDDLKNSMSTEEECLDVMKRKSGSLMALASVCGMLLANVNYPEVEAYSYQFGIAAQTDNDFRDLFNLQKSDVSTQKRSLALLYLQKGYNAPALEILTFFESGGDFNEEFGSMEIYKQKLLDSGVTKYLNVLKQIAINKAKRLLEGLPIESHQIEYLKSQLIVNNKPTNEER